MCVYFEKFVSINAGCGWSQAAFIETNFSKLTHNNQIFRNDFVFTHCLLCKITPQIIECNFFLTIFSNNFLFLYITTNFCRGIHNSFETALKMSTQSNFNWKKLRLCIAITGCKIFHKFLIVIRVIDSEYNIDLITML